MKVGDKVQYNKKYNPKEVVTILKMDSTHAVILFPSGGKIATPISGLWRNRRGIKREDSGGWLASMWL